MGYAGITFLLFAAYTPLIWVIYRVSKKHKGFGASLAILFPFFLMGVWIVGFLTRAMFAGAIEHLIVVGALCIILVAVTELFMDQILRRLSRRKRMKRRIGSLFIFFFLIVIVGNSLLSIRKTMESARHFESMVTIDETNLPFIITNEAAEIDSRIRLVTKEFAISRAEQNKATFGSNVELAQANVIYVNGSIYWCMVYAPKSSAQFWQPRQFNKVLGLILVQVNNPNADPITIEFADGTFNYAEGLWRNHNVNLKSYRRDQGAKYFRSYPAWTGTEWVYVVTRTTRDVYGAWQSDGVDVVDIATGDLIIHYGVDELDETPDYIMQIYSEDLIEYYWIDNWGKKRDTSVDGNIRLFSGFPNYSPDRIGFYGDGVEDIRYVVYRNETLAFFATHPLDSTETLAGIGVMKKSGVTYYDLRDEGFISATTASQLATGQLTAPNEGRYIVQMPVPYTLNTSAGHRLVWFVPIYWESGTVQRLSHMCVVDARETSYITVVNAEGLSGSEAVKEARLNYKAFFSGEKPEKVYEIAQIEDVGSYVEGGSSIFIFQLNDSRTIRCSQEYLNQTHWNNVVLADVGEQIQYTFTVDEDGILWATEFFLL